MEKCPLYCWLCEKMYAMYARPKIIFKHKYTKRTIASLSSILSKHGQNQNKTGHEELSLPTAFLGWCTQKSISILSVTMTAGVATNFLFLNFLWPLPILNMVVLKLGRTQKVILVRKNSFYKHIASEKEKCLAAMALNFFFGNELYVTW